MTITREYNLEVKTMRYYTEAVGALSFSNTTDQCNAVILQDFYAAVEWLLQQGYDEYHEEYSNTISPATQNAFQALRSYRVIRNGHYKSVKIFHRFWGGCVITECNLANEWSM